MIEHTPILVVIAPLLGGPIALLLGLWTHRGAWHVAVLTALGHLGLAGVLGWQVATTGNISYATGGFRLPYGIELVADGLSVVVVALIGVVFVAVLAYARHAGSHGTGFYSLLCLLVAGLTGMTVTGDAFNLYVFLEIAGLSAYALIASGEEADAAVAAFKYLLMGTVGASMYLLGVGLLLIATGTLNMADLAARIAAVGYTSPLVVAAFGLIVGGLAVKVALFPVHTWQPDAYATAPASVSTVVSALVSTVAAYALGRLILSVFSVEFLEAVPNARTAVLVAAGISIVAGSVLAVLQTEIRRVLAYSSVSQFGMIVAAFTIATPAAVVGGTVHLVGHAIMKGGLFATAGLVAARTGDETVDEYRGLGRRDPLVAGAFAVLALAMVGVPPAVGFVGKWYIVVGAVEAEAWAILAVLLASTLLTLAYFASIVERMFFRRGPPTADSTAGRPITSADGPGSRRATLGMVAVVVGAAVAAVALGLLASGIEPLVRTTLEGVLAGT
jgi:multicomponent Na+:H+ antiporter subunit D